MTTSVDESANLTNQNASNPLLLDLYEAAYTIPRRTRVLDTPSEYSILHKTIPSYQESLQYESLCLKLCPLFHKAKGGANTAKLSCTDHLRLPYV